MPATSGDQQVPRSEEVFISYSRKDKEFVRRLDEELKRRDREAWVDWEGIPPGDTWEKTIYGAIESTHTFIFVLTPDSIASEVCGREIAHAAANNKRLVPIVYRDVEANKVPKSLGELNWIFYRDSDDFEKATDTLIRALDTDLKWVRAHTRLLTRAIEWNANGRNNSFVLRGEDLRSAERWLAEAGAQKERQPTALQTEYIIASRKAAARRQRITIGALIFGLVVASVLAVVAFHQRNIAEEQARIALSRELAAGAAHSSDKELKVLLAREAVSVTYSVDKSVTAEAAEILRTSAPPEPITLSIGHTEPITALAFSPDGTRLATGSEKFTKIWDASSGDDLLTVSNSSNAFGTYGKMAGLAWSSDGRRLLGASENAAKVWDSAAGRDLFIWQSKDGVSISDVAMSADGQRCAILKPYEVRVWDIGAGAQLWAVSDDNGKFNSNLVFTPDGKNLIIANATRVQFLEVSTGHEVLHLTSHVQAVSAVALSPDGKRLATISGERNETVKVWDLADLTSPHELLSLSNPTETVTHIVFSPNPSRLAIASEKRARVLSHSGWQDGYAGHSTVKVLDILSNTEAFVLPDQTKAIIRLTFSPDGAQLATASSDEVCLWDAASGVQLRKLAGKNFAAFNKDGKLLASPGEGAQAKIWDLTSGSELLTLLGQADLRLGGGAFSPDRQRLATKGSDGKVRVWDITTGRHLSTIRSNHSRDVDAIAFSPNGMRLGISSLGVPGAVTLFDAVTGAELQRLNGNGRILSIAFNPDGTKVAAGSNEDKARLWDATSGHELRTFNSKSVCGIAFSPDGTRVATVNRVGEGMLWETSSGRSLLSLSDYRRAGFGLLFSPDGTRLATEQQIWDSASGRQLFALGQPGSSGDVGTVRIAFSPDGKLFATGGDKAKLWDASSGQELLTFEDSANVNCVVFSVDGKYLATVCDDWTVRLHPIRIEELMALAHKQVARELSVEEREKYLHTKSGK